MVMSDIEIIRAVRILCLQHKFDEAISLAQRVEDTNSRQTLTAICTSFRHSQIRVQAA